MMPMLWTLMFIMSFSMLFILSSMIYFFHLPKISSSLSTKMKNYNKLHKWNWMW